jgi:hypothetical protein
LYSEALFWGFDLIKLVMGLIATVAALVLGLLISSAHRS